MKKLRFSLGKPFMALLAVALVFGLALAGCSGEPAVPKIHGLTYSATAEAVDWQGESMKGYLIEHTYAEAISILTTELGAPNGWCFLQDDWSSIKTRPNWVILQVKSREIRLVNYLMQVQEDTTNSAYWGW